MEEHQYLDPRNQVNSKVLAGKRPFIQEKKLMGMSVNLMYIYNTKKC